MKISDVMSTIVEVTHHGRQMDFYFVFMCVSVYHSRLTDVIELEHVQITHIAMTRVIEMIMSTFALRDFERTLSDTTNRWT